MSKEEKEHFIDLLLLSTIYYYYFQTWIFLDLTMASSNRHYCQNKPDSFCYICGTYTFLHQKRDITSFVRRAYKAYF